MVEQPENFPEQADLAKLRESKSEIMELRASTDELVDAILTAKEGIDAKLATIVENFSPARIDPVDRAILRLGTYEVMHTDTPPKVVINEAIELAKRFGTTDSGRFVNGILDKIANG
jgi:N utilization substance protein B